MDSDDEILISDDDFSDNDDGDDDETSPLKQGVNREAQPPQFHEPK